MVLHGGNAGVGVEQETHGRGLIQRRRGGNVALCGAFKGGVVDTDGVEESRRPGRWLERFQDHGFALAADGNGVAGEVKAFGQFHRLAAGGVDDLGGLW